MSVVRILFLAVMLFLISCEKKAEIPEGFELVASDGWAHFVYVSRPDNINDKLKQRTAGKAICELKNTVDYCEVYMWSDRTQVVKNLPIMNKDTIIGLYKQKDGKVRLKAIWEDKIDDKEWFEKGIGHK